MKRILSLSLLSIFILSSLFSSSWSGTYKWVNPTSKNNGGKMRELTLIVEDTDEEWKREIWLFDNDDFYRIFPFLPPTDPEFSLWHKFDEDSEAGNSFRHNNKKINTSPFKPGKWQMTGVISSDDESKATITVSAFTLKVSLETTFSFSLDENGKEQLTFWMDTDLNLADGMFFKNPEAGSEGKFVLVKTN